MVFYFWIFHVEILEVYFKFNISDDNFLVYTNVNFRCGFKISFILFLLVFPIGIYIQSRLSLCFPLIATNKKGLLNHLY